MKQRLFWLLAGSALLLALAACGSQNGKSSTESASSHAHEEVLPNGDTQVETASLTVMPDFLNDRPEQVKLAYAAAAKLRDTLQYIPCYCGCAESAGHKSNLDCFIADVGEDGTVRWDDHGTTCGVCQQIVLQTAQLKSAGKTDLEIRQFIDQTYGAGGYAAPTDTVMPVA